VYCKIPFKPVSAANLKALLMASTLVFSFKITLISINEPFGTGTRMPHPPILPSKSGKIAVIALAAPVVVVSFGRWCNYEQ